MEGKVVHSLEDPQGMEVGKHEQSRSSDLNCPGVAQEEGWSLSDGGRAI